MDYPSDASVNLYNGKFFDGDPAQGIPASLDRGAEMNDVFDEVINLITVAGLTPDENDLTQVAQAVIAIVNANTIFPGSEMLWPSSSPPAGWLEEDGSLLSMTSYEPLFDNIGITYGKDAGFASTFDNLTNTITFNGHGFTNNSVTRLSNSGGALPTGLNAAAKYFIISATANTFQVSLTLGGGAVDFSDNGTGTNYFHKRFALPDARGEHMRIWDHGASNDPDAATRTDRGDGTTGDAVGTKQADEVRNHTHLRLMPYGTSATGGGSATGSGGSDSNVAATGGNETRGRNTYRMLIMKY